MIQKILVPLDGSALSESALPQAMSLAKAFDAEVAVLRVHEPWSHHGAGALVDSVTWRLERAEDQSYVEGWAAKLRAQGVRAAAIVGEGEPAAEILNQVEVRGADLVVLASHGRGRQKRFRIGGTAQKVLSRGSTSILIARGAATHEEAGTASRPRRIMVPLDCSQRAQWALLQAAFVARAQGCELLLVHVVSPPRLAGRTVPTQEETDLARRIAERDRKLAETYLAEMKDLMAGSGVAARSLLIESPHVVQTLDKVAAEERVSLVVISAHGCSGAAPWPYGSVADRLIHHGTVPLLVLQDLAAPEPDAADCETPVLASRR